MCLKLSRTVVPPYEGGDEGVLSGGNWRGTYQGESEGTLSGVGMKNIASSRPLVSETPLSPFIREKSVVEYPLSCPPL